MAMTIQCEVVSAEERIFSGLVESVVATAALGELGVNYGHAPLLSTLKPGPVRLLTPAGEEQFIYVSGGFIEVQPGMVTILADSATDHPTWRSAETLKDIIVTAAAMLEAGSD